MKKNQKTIKVFSTILFLLLWVTALIVNSKNGAFLYPEYNSSVWFDILSVAYIASFCFLTYSFSDSKKLLIWYSVCVGLVVISLIIFNAVGDNIKEVISVIIGLPMAVLAFLFVLLPIGITLYHWDKTGYSYVVIILIFYVVYFAARYIKKRRR